MTVIFQNRGKQYKANIGEFLKIPYIKGLKKHDVLKFEEIIFFKNQKGETLIGSPTVKGVTVGAKVIDQIRDKKIIVFKKKRRHNYRRKIGHRQDLTLIKIEEIKIQDEQSPKKPSVKTKSVDNKLSKGEPNGT